MKNDSALNMSRLGNGRVDRQRLADNPRGHNLPANSYTLRRFGWRGETRCTANNSSEDSTGRTTGGAARNAADHADIGLRFFLDHLNLLRNDRGRLQLSLLNQLRDDFNDFHDSRRRRWRGRRRWSS